MLGEDPRQGYVVDGAFYHPTLRFWFPVPAAFQVINQPSQVLLVEAEQQAVVVLTLASESSAEEAARAWAAQEGLTVLDRGSERVNGLPAVYVVAEGQTSEGQTVRVLRYFIEHEGRVYSLAGYTLAAQYTRYRPCFCR